MKTVVILAVLLAGAAHAETTKTVWNQPSDTSCIRDNSTATACTNDREEVEPRERVVIDRWQNGRGIRPPFDSFEGRPRE